MTLPLMAIGATGVISVVANVWPEQSARTVAAAAAGDFARARVEHFKLLPLIRALFTETNPIPVKAAMALLGTCADELRLPLLPLSEANRDRLRRAMRDAELLA